MASAVFVAYCVGNIVGPQLVRSETRAEHYPALWTGLIIWYEASLLTRYVLTLYSYCITMLSASALYVILWRENKRRDALHLDEKEGERTSFADLTDKANLHFRYVL